MDTVFSRDLVEASWLYPLQDRGLRVSLGVDPAEFGADESAFVCVADGVIRGVTTTSKQEAMDTAGRALMYRNQQQAGVIVVDRLGVGGVASALREVRGDAAWDIIAYAGSEKPTQADSPYLNQRAEAYFYAQEQLQLGKVRAPKDDRTVEELCETRYFPAGHRGKIQIEPKVDIKERLGRSPDRADAWVLAVWGLKSVTPRAAHPEDLDEAFPPMDGEDETASSGSHGYGFGGR